jgi:patatin-like phospholipase/acyl hydrolase
MKYILSLDGGGIRGVFALEILQRMEDLLREEYDRKDLVLSDHFDMFAGTSTGAIIAAALCWGKSVEEILELYVRFGSTMFTPVPWYKPHKKFLVSRYEVKPLSNFLRKMFSENEDGVEPSLLDSKKLKKSLLVVVRNHSTGSAWPLTNNPGAIYNNPLNLDCNMKVPLWKVVRASTAAPIYFDPEEITLGDKPHVFVDGAITPYNNPALIAALSATLPCYNMNWEQGPDALRIVSVGTMRFSSALPEKAQKLWLGYHAAKIPAALIDGVAWQQDFMCRCLGKCLFGEPLDSEIGDLVGGASPAAPWFSYVRYNRSYKAEALRELNRHDPHVSQLDAVKAIPRLQELGMAYAAEHVKIEHLVP